jgi:acyl-CoA thioesterase-2
MPYRRIFGGQLLAQCIAIATRSAADKLVKSLHVTFPREGDLQTPVEYRVERLQDGRTFAGRFVTGWQGGKAIVTASVSLHVHEEGLDHQCAAPDVGAPEEAAAVDLSMIPWETRVVDGVDLESREVGEPELAFWMRAQEMPADPVAHQAMLAHATDLTMIGTTLRPHAGLGEADSPERIHTAVTTHTIWFHRPLRLDDWVLVAQTSPSAAGARGFAQGHAFARRGELIASFAQESMIRVVA